MADPVEDFFNSGAEEPKSSGDPVEDFFHQSASNEEPEATHSPAWSAIGATLVAGAGGATADFLKHEVTAAGANLKASGKLLYDWTQGRIKHWGDADMTEGSPRQKQIEADTYQPSRFGGMLSRAFESPFNPLNWPGVISRKVGEGVTSVMEDPQMPDSVQNAGPIVGPLVEGAANVGLGTYGAVKSLGMGKRAAAAEPQSAPRSPPPDTDPINPPSEWAHQQAQEFIAANQPKDVPMAQPPREWLKPGQTPESAAVPVEQTPPFNSEALARHIEAQTLPVPVSLTEGQATQNVHALSDEFNMRGKQPALANRFNEQNGQLIQNLNALRDRAAPDLGMRNIDQHAQTLIDSYQAKAAAADARTSAAYKALTDANGGNFPVDGQTLVSNIDRALKKGLKTGYVPGGLKSALDEFREGRPMNFEDFETLRTDAATIMRGNDGNASAAASIIRNELEKLPLQGDAAGLKPVADAARKAARDQFETIKADPAYKAVVEGRAKSNTFFDRYVLDASREDLEKLRANIGDPTINQAISGGLINHLKQRSGIVGESNGNFGQAAFNKSLQTLAPKLDLLIDPETGKSLQTLGNVARYTQFQPRGSYFNNSGSWVAAARDLAAGAAEGGVNVAAKGVPVGTWGRKFFSGRREAAAAARSLAPGAGIGGQRSLSDLMQQRPAPPTPPSK